jgi:hypothetical protein
MTTRAAPTASAANAARPICRPPLRHSAYCAAFRSSTAGKQPTLRKVYAATAASASRMPTCTAQTVRLRRALDSATVVLIPAARSGNKRADDCSPSATTFVMVEVGGAHDAPGWLSQGCCFRLRLSHKSRRAMRRPVSPRVISLDRGSHAVRTACGASPISPAASRPTYATASSNMGTSSAPFLQRCASGRSGWSALVPFGGRSWQPVPPRRAHVLRYARRVDGARLVPRQPPVRDWRTLGTGERLRRARLSVPVVLDSVVVSEQQSLAIGDVDQDCVLVRIEGAHRAVGRGGEDDQPGWLLAVVA